jgi:hypothetical protein
MLGTRFADEPDFCHQWGQPTRQLFGHIYDLKGKTLALLNSRNHKLRLGGADAFQRPHAARSASRTL